MDDDETDQYLWSDFKDLFKKEYAVQTNERLILEGLSILAIKQTEMMMSSSQESLTVRVIKESFDDYGGVIPYPPNDCNGRISNHAFRTFMRRHNAMMINVFKMNLFKAALTPEQDPETTTIKKMYQVATTAQREGKGKATVAVNESCGEEISADMEDYDNDVAAFNRRGVRPKTNQPSSQSNHGYSANRGNYRIRGQQERRPKQRK
jgi:hypothetical protein